MTEFLATIAAFPTFVQMAIMFGVAMLLATVIVSIAFPLLKRAADSTESYTLEALAKQARNAAFWLLVFLITAALWETLHEPIPDEGPDPNPFYLDPAIRIARTLMYIFGGILVIRLIAVAADTIRHRYNADQVNNLRERKILTQLQYIQKIAGIVVFIVTVSFILLQFEAVRAFGTGLLTTAGVSGIVIGLAAQKSIANLLAGLQIAFTQPIRVDDALIVNGEYGWVEEITLTYVVMRLWDQRRQIVPLNKFIDDTFQNWTRNNAELLGTVFMYVDYTFPVQKLREEVLRFVPTQTEFWDGRVANCMVTDNNENVMTIRMLVSGANAGNTFNLRCAVREHVINWCQENYPNHLPKTRVEMQTAQGSGPRITEVEEGPETVAPAQD